MCPRLVTAALLVALASGTSGCISYVTYRKIEGEPVKPGTAFLVGALEFGAGNALGAGLEVGVEEKLDGPEVDLLTWLAIGNATVLALDAIVATLLYVNRAYASD